MKTDDEAFGLFRMSNVNHESNEPGQLELDAFRFIAGEMGVEEQKLFEDRLANEPGVAEVLSQVLEIDAAVVAVRSNRSLWRLHLSEIKPRRVAEPTSSAQCSFCLPMVVALAACVLLAIAIAPTGSTDSETPLPSRSWTNASAPEAKNRS